MWAIAGKNIKNMANNIGIIIFLSIIPIFQIFIVNKIIEEASNSGVAVEAVFSSTRILSKTTEGNMQYFAVGILVQFVLMAGVIAGAMVTTEREENTLLRLFAAPVKKFEIIGGILISNSIMILLITLIITGVCGLVFDIIWAHSYVNFIIVTLVAVLAVTSLALIVSAIFKSPKIAGGVMSVVIIMMTFASGAYGDMTKNSLVSKFTINKWINDCYIALMDGKSLLDMGTSIVILIIISLILLMISVIIFGKEKIYE